MDIDKIKRDIREKYYYLSLYHQNVMISNALVEHRKNNPELYK